MYEKETLKLQLKNMGICPTDTLLVHASMKSMGEVEGGADTVLDALMEYLDQGMLMFPTHTWRQMGRDYLVFDPDTEPVCVGILPELFRKRPGVVRSLHPTHSMAVYGKKNEVYVAGEESCNTPCTPGGCWSRLAEEGAKILLIGIGHERNTYIHAVEEELDVPERLTKEPETFFIRMPDGSLKERPMYRHYNPKTDHISEAYPKLEQAFYDREAAKKVKFGDADCILCEAAAIRQVVTEVLAHEKNCLIDRETIPQGWWKKHQKG